MIESISSGGSSGGSRGGSIYINKLFFGGLLDEGALVPPAQLPRPKLRPDLIEGTP
jgi:hypothetical protein